MKGSRGKGQDSFLLSEIETKSPGRSQCERQVCSKTLRLQSLAEGAKPLCLRAAALVRDVLAAASVSTRPGLALRVDKKCARQENVFSGIQNLPPDITVPSTGVRSIAGGGVGGSLTQPTESPERVT